MIDRDPLQDRTYPPGPPEMLFRVGDAVTDRHGAAGSMESGAWMRGPDGRPSFGSLGLLVDTVFGASILRNGPGGHWAVTTEISMTRCTSVPIDGQRITAEARVAHLDAVGGISRGEVTAADGRVIALGTQHVRFTAGSVAHERSPHIPQRATSDGTVLDLVGGRDRSVAGRTVLELLGTREVCNPAGNVHGGVLLALSEIAGLLSVQSVEHPLQTASVHQTFVRPAPMGDLVRIESVVLHRGRTLAVAQVSAIREDGRTASFATVTCSGGDAGEPAAAAR